MKSIDEKIVHCSRTLASTITIVPHSLPFLGSLEWLMNPHGETYRTPHIYINLHSTINIEVNLKFWVKLPPVLFVFVPTQEVTMACADGDPLQLGVKSSLFPTVYVDERFVFVHIWNQNPIQFW